jgi:hypothetical protein
MTKQHRQVLQALKALLETSPSDLVVRGEALLKGLVPLDDTECARELFGLFTDESDHQGLLWSVLQVLETLPAPSFALALLTASPQLGRRSLAWTETFFLRALRDPLTKLSLETVAMENPDLQRSQTGRTIATVQQRNPEDLLLFQPLLSALA